MEEYILPERKAFNDWFSNVFYKKIVQKRSGREITKKVYQELLKDYLHTDTPYRGALVYHGLGTGKTATAITVTEGLRNDWEIVTILPPSLESNFVEEVKKFGDPLFRILKDTVSDWIFVPLKDMPEELKEFTKQHRLTSLFMKARAKEIKKHFGVDIEPGLWLETGEGLSGGKSYEEMEEWEKAHLNLQLKKMIEMKYNFIGYNPFPNFELRKREGRKPTDDNDRYLTKLVNEADRHGTPFNNKVVIIDEVHGFISQIVNSMGNRELQRASLVYSWIMNSSQCKIVCLSGTPIVNRPSEIAILINMLKGPQNVYTFVLNNMNAQETDEFIQHIKSIIHNSPIKQFLLEKSEGKTLLSIVRNPPNFISIIDSDIIKTVPGDNSMSEEAFVNSVYDLINERYTIESPKKKDTKKLTTSEPNDFKKVVNAFTIHDKGKEYDCTDNNVFLDMFFDPNYNIKSDRKELLKRMCSGCISYYPSSDDVVSEDMAVKNRPTEILEQYQRYKSMEFIQIVNCEMPYAMFDVYDREREEERKKLRLSRSSKKMYNFETNKGESADNNSYYIKTRILCTTAYSKEHNVTQVLEDPQLLIQYSPKLFRLMEALEYANRNNRKCMVYSKFIENGGLKNVEVLLKQRGIEYRKVTGSLSKAEKQKNIDEFNESDIPVILISESGKEGISLKNVREVHILEPHWNFTRIEQVIGRAIRKGSHNDLPISERNVSVFLYIASFPDEKDPRVLSQVPKEEQLAFSTRISNIKVKDAFGTIDQYLLSMMDTKYKISKQCKQILIEASIDCKQNASAISNVTCLDYPKLLKEEDSIFPGISNSRLGNINPKQIKYKGTRRENIFIIDGHTMDTLGHFAMYFHVSGPRVKQSELKEPIAILSYDTGRVLIPNNDCFEDPPDTFRCIGNVIQVPESHMFPLPSFEQFETLVEENVIGYKLVFNNGKEYYASKNLSNQLESRKKINYLVNWTEYEETGFDDSQLNKYTFRGNRIFKARQLM